METCCINYNTTKIQLLLFTLDCILLGSVLPSCIHTPSHVTNDIHSDNNITALKLRIIGIHSANDNMYIYKLYPVYIAETSDSKQ